METVDFPKKADNIHIIMLILYAVVGLSWER